jgi:hypothetical protein
MVPFSGFRLVIHPDRRILPRKIAITTERIMLFHLSR